MSVDCLKDGCLHLLCRTKNEYRISCSVLLIVMQLNTVQCSIAMSCLVVLCFALFMLVCDMSQHSTAQYRISGHHISWYKIVQSAWCGVIFMSMPAFKYLHVI
jgi:hypothetical protein